MQFRLAIIENYTDIPSQAIAKTSRNSEKKSKIWRAPLKLKIKTEKRWQDFALNVADAKQFETQFVIFRRG